MVCDAKGVPLRFVLSPGQASDISNAQALLDNVRMLAKLGRPCERCRCLLAAKGYDAEHSSQYCDRYRMRPLIPLRTMKRKVKVFRPSEIPVAQHHRADVRLAEGEGQYRRSLRKASKKVSLQWSRWLARCAAYAGMFRTEPSRLNI
ncbi:hypothetical protein [Pseudomonas sp. BAV 2493]|uniref:hypothetical protein n=1 Tax=unclassified Pseudomonas TaxID=196821 RepID=UPI003555D862